MSPVAVLESSTPNTTIFHRIIEWRYETEAAQLLERTGLAARVERRFLDIAQVPDEVERADVVVLHRVVCCYPD